MKKGFFSVSLLALFACGGGDGAAVDEIASSTPCVHLGPCDSASPVCRPPSGPALKCDPDCGLYLYQGELCPDVGPGGAAGVSGASGAGGNVAAGTSGSSGASAGASGVAGGGSGSGGSLAGGAGESGAAGQAGVSGSAGIGGVAGIGGSAGAGGASGFAGQAGSGGASNPLLLRAFVGPGTQDVPMGDPGRVVFRLQLKTASVPLEIRRLPVKIERFKAGSSCRLVGSDGKPHFTHLRWRSGASGDTAFGPYELPADAATEATFPTQGDSLVLPAFHDDLLEFTLDVGSSSLVGEFGDCGYRVVSVPFGPGDVRVTETGEALDLGKVVENTAIEGNEFTVKPASSATVDLGSEVVSTTVLKGTKGHRVASLVFTAPFDRDIKISTVPTRAWTVVPGSSCGNFLSPEPFACQTYTVVAVETFRLMDGDIPLASAVPTTSGVPPFQGFELVVPKGTERALTIKTDLKNELGGIDTFNRLAIGAGDPSAFVVTDLDGNPVPVLVGSALAAQLGKTATPKVVTEIVASGASTVVGEGQPGPYIVTAEPHALIAASYFHTAWYEATATDRVRIAQVSPDGDCADVAWVEIRSQGTMLGSALLPSGVTCEKDVELTTPLLTPKDGSASLEIYVAYNAPVSGAAVDGVWHGVPRSGHRNRFAIVHGSTGGEWGSAYANALNMRTVGQASGKALYSPGPVPVGQDMVLRAAVPGLTKASLPSNILSNGKMPLLRFSLEAYKGQIAWKQVPLRFSKTGGYAIGSLVLSKNGQPVKGGFNIVGADGKQWNENDQGIPAGTTDGFIVLSWGEDGEGIVSPGAPLDVELSGSPSGVKPGDVFSIELAAQKDAPFDVVTGYLVANTAFPPFAASPYLFGIDIGPWGSPSGKMAAWGWGLLWSDRSEVPHGSAIPGSSRDWTNGLYMTGVSAAPSEVFVNLSVRFLPCLPPSRGARLRTGFLFMYSLTECRFYAINLNEIAETSERTSKGSEKMKKVFALVAAIFVVACCETAEQAESEIRAEEAGETSDELRGPGNLKLPERKGAMVRKAPLQIPTLAPRPTVTPLPPGTDFTKYLPGIVVGGDVVSYGAYRIENPIQDTFVIESVTVRQVSGRAADIADVIVRFEDGDPACDPKFNYCVYGTASSFPDAAGDWTIVPLPRPIKSGSYMLVDLRAVMAPVSDQPEGAKSGDRPVLEITGMRVRRLADGVVFDQAPYFEIAMPKDPLRGVARLTLRKAALGVYALPLSPNQPSPLDTDGWNLLAQGEFSARGGAVDLAQFALKVEGIKNPNPGYTAEPKSVYTHVKFQVGEDTWDGYGAYDPSMPLFASVDDGPNETVTVGKKDGAWTLEPKGEWPATLPFKVWAKFSGPGLVSGHAFKVRWLRSPSSAAHPSVTGCLTDVSWFLGRSLNAEGLTQDPEAHPFWKHAPELEPAFLWSDKSAKGHDASMDSWANPCSADRADWTDGYGVSGFPSWNAAALQHLVVPLSRGFRLSRPRLRPAGFCFSPRYAGELNSVDILVDSGGGKWQDPAQRCGLTDRWRPAAPPVDRAVTMSSLPWLPESRNDPPS